MCDETKLCTKCGVVKGLLDFSIAKRSKDGRQIYCKLCDAKYRKFVSENKENLITKRNNELARKELLLLSGDKVCSICKEIKPVHEFYKSTSKGYQAQCKVCSRERNKTDRQKEYFREYRKEYAKNNKSLFAYYAMKRHTQKLRATVSWANMEKLVVIYEQCALITEETGIRHEVDHIIPLQNKLVCGLHCEDNLQILTKEENLKKKNKYWPDMPD